MIWTRQIYRCRFTKVFVKIRRLVDKFAVSNSAFRGNDVHHFVPQGHVVATVSRHGRRKGHGTGHLLKCTQGDAAQTVLLIDDLALLRYAKAAVHGAWRCAEYCDMCLAAATTDCAATSMEQSELNAPRFNSIDECDLHALQCPTGGRETAVLIAIGVTDHHGLPIVAAREMFAIYVGRQNGRQNVTPVVEVIHGLKQGCNVERYVTAAIM